MKKGNNIHSVSKAMQLLEIISEEKEIGIRELSRKSGFNKSTVYNLVTGL